MADVILRDHQSNVLDRLRDSFKAGNRAVMLYAPTGAGKTEMAIHLMNATDQNGKRSAMILDRIVLCNQTSERLQKYGIDHGVLQSGHWRYRPDRKIQICSAQTLEKRGSFPGLDLLIIDEAHAQRAQTVEFIKQHPKLRVIGLSASPFTKGLGKTYSDVVSSTTTGELVNQGWLAGLRVFVAKEIDMTGAKKVAGEWSQNETTERGIKITGDVVAEWVKKTHEIFGGPKKTIVFCSGVAHGADLSQRFAQAGYNFLSISYKDDDDFKREAIEDFSRPDTEIHGLIATDILTKGFDVPDVMIGISARPFSKSFSSHVQQMGRVMRAYPGKEYAVWIDHCIATGQRVLTHRGLVPIELILLSDRIWDGHAFVSHKGVISRGKRPVIEYAGLTATADHLVFTRNEGWCSLGYCADKQASIVTTGVGRTALRQRDDYFTAGGMAWPTSSAVHACALRVRHLWLSVNNFFDELAGRYDERVSPMQSAEASSAMAERKDRSNARPMQEQEQRSVRKLWWKGNSVQVRFGDFLRSLDTRELGMLSATQGYGTGSNRQQRELRAWQSSLGNKNRQYEQSSKFEMDADDASVQVGSPGSSLRGYFAARLAECWAFLSGNRGTMGKTIVQTEREVWDILDCGPRNSFTCEGLLVHNSGNYLRFQDQWDELYNNGVSELDDGAEKTKPEPTDQEKERAKCPQCGAFWPPNSDSCPHCGFIHVKRNAVQEVSGEVVEIGTKQKTEKYSSEYKEHFYQQLLGYARNKGYADGWAFHAYKEKFAGTQPSWKKVAAVPGEDVIRFVRHRAIKSAKSKAA